MFQNNAGLRKAGEPYPYTDEQIHEIIRCQEDIIYFAEKYFQIVTIDRGKELIELYEWQKKVLKAYQETPGGKRSLIIKIARQSGKTTVTNVYLLWYILFNKDKTAALMANKESTAIEILSKIKMAFKNLPLWMQVGIVEGGWNQKSIVLENGTRVIAAATSTDAMSGFTINLLYLDEFAKVPNHVAEEFISSVYPVISSGKTSKIIILSCVTKDTFVFGKDGLSTIERFVDNTKSGGYEVPEYTILGRDGFNTGKYMVNSGIAKTNIIETTFGELECSTIHKLWACKKGKYDWYKSDELVEGDYISIKYGMDVWGNQDICNFKSKKGSESQYSLEVPEITNDWAYFLGLFIAEGCARNNNNSGSVTITCGDDISGIFNKLNLKYNLSKDGFHYTHCRQSLVEFLEFLGFDISLKAKQKVIPDRLLKLSREKTICLLRGLFDGDGYSRLDRGIVGYSSTSKTLVLQVKFLLLNLGLLTDIHGRLTPPTKKVKVSSFSYTISLNRKASNEFYKLIGFNIPRKQIKQSGLNLQFKTRDSYDVIPFSKAVLKDMRNRKLIPRMETGKIGKSIHLSRNYWLKYKEQYLGLNDLIINEFYDKNIKEDIIWYKIKKITKSENEVFDFSLNEVKDDFWCHSVIYGGVLGHQTPLGLNHFYEFWTRALRKGEDASSFYPIRVGWWEVPGRDEVWKKKMIADIGKIKFSQEFACLCPYTIVNIKDIKTGEIKKIKVCELFENENHK